MAISYVGSASGTTSATLPTHQAGDLIVGIIFRSNSTTTPTIPAGWTSGGLQTGLSMCRVIVYRTATASGTTTGTFTNATQVVFAVYRNAVISFDSQNGSNATSTATLTLNYLNTGSRSTSVPLYYTSSWVILWAGYANATTNIETAPSGFVNRKFQGGTGEVALHDSNGSVSSWSGVSQTLTGTAGNYMSGSLELFEKPAGAIRSYINTVADFGVDNGTTWSTTTIRQGRTGGVNYRTAYRFTSLAVPQDALIVSASFQWAAQSSYQGSEVAKFYGDAVDNSGALSATHMPSVGMTQTTASTDFIIGDQSSRWIDVTNIIQEIVNRPGWVSGNAITIFSGSTASFTAAIFQQSAATTNIENNPQLYIDWTTKPPPLLATGQTTINFSNTGKLKGKGLLASITSTLFSSTSVLKGSGRLLGNSLPVFTTSGLSYVNKTPSLVLSNNDNTASSTVDGAKVRSNEAHSSGKYYFEYSIDAGVDSSFELDAGIIPQNFPFTEDYSNYFSANCMKAYHYNFSATPTTDMYVNGSFNSTIQQPSNSSIWCVAVDFDNKKLWWKKAGGDWNNDFSANPATGTNGIDISSLPTTDYTVAFGLYGYGNEVKVTSKLYNASFSYTKPAGFNAWSPDPPFSFILGSSDLIYTTTGILKGRFSLSGLSNVVATNAGILRGSIFTSGASSFQFSDLGILVGSAKNIGQSNIIVTTSGKSIGSAKVVGLSNMTYNPSGKLVGYGVLTGNSDFSFITAAFGTSGSPISGTSGIIIGESATLKGVAKLEGLSQSPITLDGVIGGIGNVNGQTFFTFVTQGKCFLLKSPFELDKSQPVNEIFDISSITPAYFFDTTSGISPAELLESSTIIPVEIYEITTGTNPYPIYEED